MQREFALADGFSVDLGHFRAELIAKLAAADKQAKS